MRLPRPFHQLPLLFDAALIQAEIAALPAAAWVSHPDRLPGNRAVRLVSVEGRETDAVHGPMQPTRWLEALPGVRRLLASIGVVWGRSRLMRLAPGAGVPEHADIAHHWHRRVRVHLPIATSPEILFHCGGAAAHMAAGEGWILDTWRRHRVQNPTAAERIHLVADTTGTAGFWQAALDDLPPRDRWRRLPSADGGPALLTERNERSPVMPAAEVQMLVDDLRGEVTAGRDGESRGAVARFGLLLTAFVHDGGSFARCTARMGGPRPSSCACPSARAPLRPRSATARWSATMAWTPGWCSPSACSITSSSACSRCALRMPVPRELAPARCGRRRGRPRSPDRRAPPPPPPRLPDSPPRRRCANANRR